MSVFYIVDPLDDEHREWLEEVGVALPRGRQPSRNPTPVEIRTVCDALKGVRVKYNASAKKKFWQALIEGVQRANADRGALLTIEKWGGSEDRRYKFMFENGHPGLVVEIVHGLSATCGPLVVIPDSGDTPIVVWPEADRKKLRRAWA